MVIATLHYLYRIINEVEHGLRIEITCISQTCLASMTLEPTPSPNEITVSQNVMPDDISEEEFLNDIAGTLTLGACEETNHNNVSHRCDKKVVLSEIMFNDDVSLMSLDAPRHEPTNEGTNQSAVRNNLPQSNRMTVSAHRDVSTRFTSDLTERHEIKRTTKEIIKLNHISKDRYIMTWDVAIPFNRIIAF